jgi:hypothetical protein
MDHTFVTRVPEDGLVDWERLCNEPNVPGAPIKVLYHLDFEELANGDFVCRRCGAAFLDNDSQRPYALGKEQGR